MTLARFKNRMVEGVVRLAASARIGDPSKPATQVGPITTRPQRDRILSYPDIGRESGREAIDAYLQTKTVWIDTVGKTANPFVIR